MPLSSYLTRLIWLCVLPLVLFSSWLAYDIVHQIERQQDREAEIIARNFATAIDYHLNARIGSLKVMAASPLADDPIFWPIYYKVSQGFRANFGAHVIFAEAQEPRRMLFNTRAPFGVPLPVLPIPTGNSAAERALTSGQPAVGDIVFGPVAREKLIALAVPLLRDGQVVKILMATFDLRMFQDRLEQVELPAGWRLSLLDGQNELIARHQADEAALGDGFDTSRHVAVSTNVGQWKVVLDIQRRRYATPLVNAGVVLGSGLLAMGLIGIGGGLWGTRRLSRAVASLANPTNGTVKAEGPEIAEFVAVRERIDVANRQIASFAAQQDQAIEQERRRVAREVHDQMGQAFTAIRLIVQSIPRDAFPAGQEAALHQALDMGIASARKITAELRPPLLDDLGLAAALNHLSKELMCSTELACVVDLNDQEQLCGPQALVLYRIAQEALTNILRHADAKIVEIIGYAEGNLYRMSIEDDGSGFVAETVRQGALGLVSMRERARLMNGECTISSPASGGTRITICLPLDKNLSGTIDETSAA
jgi:signal transduction histidine kinase